LEITKQQPDAPSAYIEASIGLLEIRNYKAVVRADRDDFNLIALSDSYNEMSEGHKLWLRPVWDQVMFFDKDDNRVLAVQEST
jgi:hypothetical protein